MCGIAIRCLSSMAAVLAVAGSVARAGIVYFDPQTWNVAGTANWADAAPQGTEVAVLDNPLAGGADGAGDGYLRITFPDQGFPFVVEDTVYNNIGVADKVFLGNYQELSSGGVGFSFYAQDMLPISSALYFHSAVSDEIWSYAFANAAVGAWESHSIPFQFGAGAGWSGWGGASDFWADLANVDWIGVNVQTLGSPGSVYGIDSFQYYIPEPGTMYMLIAALLSLGGALRYRPDLFVA